MLLRNFNIMNSVIKEYKDDNRKGYILVILFMIFLTLPVSFNIGPARLTPYRILLILLTIPCLISIFSKPVGKLYFFDIALMLLAIWGGITLIYVHGLEAIEPAVILFLEMYGAYLLGRCYIRNAYDFHRVMFSLFCIVVALIPFALYENLTGNAIALKLFDPVFTVFREIEKQPRWGLDRAQGPFEHPILFGVFCSVSFAFTFYVVFYGRSFFYRCFQSFIVSFATVLSLSSGPITGLFGQAGLIGWGLVTKGVEGRWHILVLMIAGAWIAVDLYSNRSPPAVFISRLAFNQDTAYMRLLIWEYGSNAALAYPIFGNGFNDWDWARPDFMTSTIDMFFLALAIRHGIIFSGGLLILFITIGLKLMYKKIDDDFVSACRMACVVCFCGYFLTAWTVLFWNANFVLFFLMIGSSIWILGHENPKFKDESHTEMKTKKIKTILG